MKKIEELIETAKRHSNEMPLASLDQLQNSTNEIQLNKGTSIHIFNLKRRIFTMASIGTIIFTGALYLFLNQNPVTEKNSYKQEKEQQLISKIQSNENVVQENNNINIPKKTEIRKESEKILYKDITYKYPLDPDTKITNVVNNDPYDITGISSLNLTNDELKKLNVFIHLNSIEIINQDIKTQLSNYEADLIKRDGKTVDANKYYIITYKNILEGNTLTNKIQDLKEFDLNNPEYIHVHPVIYTCRYTSGNSTMHSVVSPILYFSSDSIGRNFLHDKMSFRDKVKELNTLIEHNDKDKINDIVNDYLNLEITQNKLMASSLIPIRIEPKLMKDGKLITDKFILFFYPNEEFLNAIPYRYREQIKNEMALINKIQKNEIQPEDACKGLNEQKSVLDICRMQSGAITKALVYPNPAKDRVNIKINLTESRKISVSLHDVNGGCLLSPILSMKLKAGEETLNFDLPDLANGIYLIAIQSPNGEQVVQKIIISK